MRSSSHLYAIMILLTAALLSGCDSGGNGDEQTRIRLLNASPGYTSLDLYANDDDDDSDQLRVSAASYDTVSSYARFKSGTYTVKFKRNGVASTLQTMSGKQFADDSHHTFVAYGTVGHFGALQISEGVSDADSGNTKVQLLNTAEAGALDVYITESSVSLDDASPTFTNIGAGTASSITTIDSGDYRLRVTGANDTDDLRLDVPTINFASKKVVSLILSATQGGVLVNALVLPQQGDLTRHANTKARVRGAVGIGNGTTVTARVGGVSVVSSAAIGVVGNYAQVDAGSATVSLIIDGSPVSVANQSLTAGGDYTLLIWSNAGGTQTTLISDDNRLPTTSGKAKIRVLNGLSALSVPITMAVDFSPIAEGIALGEASTYTEVDGGSEYQLDITNATTAANLLTRSSVSLQSAGVYTMFMSANGTAVSGTLRKDR